MGTKRKEYEAGTKYKKWKRDLAIWNDRYKEEWQEQQYEKKLKREEAKKKRAARKAKKEKKAQEAGSDDDDEKDDEKNNKKKKKKATNNKGKKKATTNGNKRGRGRPKKKVNVQNSVFIPNQKCNDSVNLPFYLIFDFFIIHFKRPCILNLFQHVSFVIFFVFCFCFCFIV